MGQNLRTICFLGSLVIALLLTSGCATTYKPVSKPYSRGKGVYHKVQKGETLWRIANAYQANVDDVVRSNNIPNVAHIEDGQLIFIPGAVSVRSIPLEDNEVKAGEFVWPVEGKVVSYFNQKKGSQFNNGISIRTTEGKTVQAARDGRVVFADYLSGYAYTVVIDHLDGYYTVYSQNSTLLVEVGKYVLKGDPIARVGRSGDLAFLHFEVRRKSQADNPLYYLP